MCALAGRGDLGVDPGQLGGEQSVAGAVDEVEVGGARGQGLDCPVGSSRRRQFYK
jgi:hypothetical protein